MFRRSGFGDDRSAAMEYVPRGWRLASGASILTLGAVLWPIVQNWRRTPSDGFPFSYYPMFSAKRTEKSRVAYLVGLEADGTRHLLHYRYAGSGGHNQVRRQIRRMTVEGRAEELCERVIANLARQGPRLHRKLATVQVVIGEYLLDDYFGGGSREPLREKVYATVAVHPSRETSQAHGNPTRSIGKGAA